MAPASPSPSIVSIEPAVVRQIILRTGDETTEAAHARPARSASRTQDAVLDKRWRTRRPQDERPGPTGAGASLESLGRTRNNSLRHVKNSKELLRQRSLKRNVIHGLDAHASSKEGRNFTVGNVGTGGLIYLRPSTHQAQAPAQALPPLFAPLTPPHTARLESHGPEVAGDDHRHSIWSTSQMSDCLALPYRSPNASRAPTTAWDAGQRPGHQRTSSVASTDNHERYNGEAQEGTLRIVINRSVGKQSRPATTTPQPTLEVPIPHYRIGTPRFSTQGTPILRNSVYSRTSASASSNYRASTSATPTLLFPVRHTSSAADQRTRPLSDMPAHAGHTSAKSPARHTITAAAQAAGPTRPARRPADAALFDDLIHRQDDPSVVRYARRTGDIVAATPARIIAQISSASFMDYELVSDFFLTFRSYLSAAEVLELLLARLRWAINRLEDDGRIIRIRTFAALRHWILNYFMDDFVVSRKLRGEFCHQINDMYREVKQRQGGGTSDLKILQDLKRCWNGRCSLYWDSDDFVVDSHQEADIVPGVVLGSRTSSRTRRPGPVEPGAQTRPEPGEDGRAASQSWFEVPPPHPTRASPRRQESTDEAEGPLSIGSEKSLQPMSCSILTKSLRRSPRLPNGTKAPHPVPSASRRQLSPSAPGPPSADGPRPAAASTHNRSGSFTDSTRDRTSRHSSNPDFVVRTQAGSLIRGNVIPPGTPYLDMWATAPKLQEPSAREGPWSGPMASATEGLGIHMMTNGGVKTFIGSIRRALSTRQPVTGAGLINVANARTKLVQEGKTSALPLNLTRSNDALRTKAGVPVPSRTHLRIDLLCAAVLQSYQAVQDRQGRQSETAAHHRAPALSEWERSLAVPDPSVTRAGDERPSPRRLRSQGTAQSGSIVIVDDTGFDMPSMSGALPVPTLPPPDSFPAGGRHSTTNTATFLSQSTYLGLPSTPSASQRSSGVFARRRSSSVDTGIRRLGHGTADAGPARARPWSRASTTRRSQAGHARKHQSAATATTVIRRSTSYDSGLVVRPEPAESRGGIATALVDRRHDPDDESHLPAHILRRRPGGDLRKVQNVHDLDGGSRHQSVESASSDSDSAGGSLVIMANRPTDSQIAAPARASTGSVSLIHTHSSQRLRPSFEAAVSGFSAIPDDEDGGLEATLLKLEGRYEKQSPNPTSASAWPHPDHVPPPTGAARDDRPRSNSDRAMTSQSRRPSPPAGVPPRASAVPRRATHDLQKTETGTGPSSRRSSIYGLPTESIASSDDSYNSVPLLERGMTDAAAERQTFPRSKPAISIPRPLFDNPYAAEGQTLAESSHPSIEIVEETGSMRDILPGSTIPMTQRSPTAHSFLLDADENLSDLSSELSVDIINHSDVVARNPSPLLAAPGTAISGFEIPTHPLAHPPSPSFTLHRLATPQTVNPMMFQKPPLTPDPSPTQLQQPFHPMINHPPAAKDAPAASPAKVAASSGHMPWILAYDAELLAEQMTFVEKAALSEIDWSDLVNMQWDNSATAVLNWVDFVSAADHKGIDLVIARFNIMVKWALSEIVLTQNIHERAQTIMKYIHLAAQARRLHNYATMLQITIALTSSDCSRLRKTWELVNPPERSLLKNMEALIQPLRNFHDLRLEMETADLTEGCIPFVGLYIHDLTYNAQKPAQIANARGTEPLINFERYRTTAAIVKGLLRLIDASSQFNFPPVEGVLDRCLWMAALSDDRISALSRDLEP